ncbi:tRNA-specific adenosine deaminase 1 [Dermatophagoides farinae]|uniref:tRNA-specific adenosine deaminase 1 n=1 Tax=Dermatophagoides farinae TaxID=6954 RepID=UPI003F645416
MANKRIRLDECDPTDNEPEIDPNVIASLCYDSYNKLGKSGKPNPRKNEYTIIAGLVEYRDKSSPTVVCLTTGTKCFPKNVPYRDEDIVDCHAEPLLKRAFKCYLNEVINDWIDDNKKLDQFYDEVIRGRHYCLFVSQFPCGSFSRWKGDPLHDSKNQKICVNRKPGRGELCPKAACVHKIAKWRIFGLQGSRILDIIGKPITFNHIVIGNCETEYRETMEELDSIKDYLITIPNEYSKISNDLIGDFQFSQFCHIHFAQQFRHPEFVRNNIPCGSSIVAWMSCDRKTNLKTEILANGRRLGAAKRKTFPNILGTSRVCDFYLRQNLEQLIVKFNIKNINSEKYQKDWSLTQKNLSIFKDWPIIDI